MMKATPKFDKESGKWVIDVETEEGEVIKVGKTINKEINLWKISKWDTKEQAEDWIKSKSYLLILS